MKVWWPILAYMEGAALIQWDPVDVLVRLNGQDSAVKKVRGIEIVAHLMLGYQNVEIYIKER
jgi:hypothetical protein